MYERAADPAQGPLWHVEGAHTFFTGPLRYNASHQHGAPVFLAGLQGPFGLRLGERPWRTCRAAMIPAGTAHELDVGGNPLAVLYVEPGAMGHRRLSRLLRGASEIDGVLIGQPEGAGLLREVFESGTGADMAAPALADLIAFARRRDDHSLDPRIVRAVERMARLSCAATATILAAEAGLSISRFQHLFTRETGVPVRRYRAWLRMRAAIAEIVAGSNFTAAAHAAGFADQPHFAHDFRRTFGAPASASLLHIRRPTPPRRTLFETPLS
ncbi:helix-turn-helix domain-containing protein [Methylobacterium oxalidis]|uniref:helix-turn-helix domain-containing protein n=1 Tax=Methylobacterium oxalidis TaxID=944322 RepID=UPI001EDE670B|nr:helix-turn-helix domain-containing protein [Methylobacterium oxalidis]